MTSRTTFFLFILVTSSIVSAFLWPYSVNAWLEYAGKEPAMLWWHGVLLGLVPGIGQTVIIVAAVTWISMLFLV